MKARTYRYFGGAPLYRFGLWPQLHHTSTTPRESFPQMSIPGAGEHITVSVQVTNTGILDGDEDEIYLVPKSVRTNPTASFGILWGLKRFISASGSGRLSRPPSIHAV